MTTTSPMMTTSIFESDINAIARGWCHDGLQPAGERPVLPEGSCEAGPDGVVLRSGPRTGSDLPAATDDDHEHVHDHHDYYDEATEL